MSESFNQLQRLKKIQGGFRGSLKRLWRAGKVNISKYPVRHFGQVPYFDIETGQTVDLRPFLSPGSRKPGISGFMRLKNEEQFVEMAIESVIDCLDELVVVHNGCTDHTPEIVESCRARYPDRIRVYEYAPVIAQPGSADHQRTPMGSPHSMVNYYNFALAKTTHRIAIKIDGDECYLKGPFKRLADEVRAGEQSIPIGVSGVNLWDEGDEIHVNDQHPIMSGLDKGFFTVNQQSFFVHYPLYEVFTYAFGRSAGIYFYHLKGLKADRGLGNYFTETGETRFSSAKVQGLKSPELMPWKEFHMLMGNSEALPEPTALGLHATVRVQKA